MKKLLLAGGLFLAGAAQAQNNEAQELDAVTVTASILPRKVSETGRNMVTISGEAFNRLPVHSVDELLRFIPGLEVQMRGPMGAQSDIVLRGGTFQQVLVLLDGVRINDPNTGHFSSYIPISPAEIERVEVLKGASSAIYGSEAVGGVVHIITRSFAARRQQQQTQINAGVTAGQYNLFNAQAGGYYQKGNTAIGGGWLSNNTNGQPQRGTKGFVHNNTVSASLTHFFDEHWQLSVRGAYDNRDFAAQNFYTTFLSDTATEQVKTIWTQAALQYKNAQHKVSLTAAYKDVQDDYAYNKVSIANANKSRMLQALLMDEWQWRPATTLITGMQFISKQIRSNDRGNHQVAQGGAFVLVHHTIAQRFSIDPALRFEYNERSGAEWIPQLNLSYKQNKWQWRASAGKTIRDADFTERFNNYNKPVVASGGRIGDPDLLAERSLSYEAGADYYPVKWLRISGTFFQRYHKRLIDYAVTPYADMPRKDNLVAGGTYALARNIAKVNTTGAELDVQVSKQLTDHDQLQAAMGLVWLDSKGADATPSFYLSSHARWLTNLYAAWQGRHLQLSINAIYKTRSRQNASAINATLSKEYFVMNARAAWYLPKTGLNLFVQADNVFDQSYSDLLGAVMPGRWLMGGINFRFLR